MGKQPILVAGVCFIILGMCIVFSCNAFAKSNVAASQEPPSSMRRAAQDHILVKFRKDTPKVRKEEVYSRHGLKERSEIPRIGFQILAIDPSDTPEEVVQRIKIAEKESVEFVEPDYFVPPDFIPNDPLYSYEWHMTKINAPAAYDVTHGSSAVVIAVLDSGVDSAHADLSGRLVPGWNFMTNTADTSPLTTHGTSVAGAAAAAGNNALGVAGTCMNCSIMPVVVTDSSGYGSVSAIANGLVWAADHGARVANLSFQSVQDYTAVCSAAKYFNDKGGLTTGAAGNTGTYDATPNDPSIITVSATDSADVLASFSTTGAIVDLSAPGVNIWTTNVGGGYSAVSGTSFSAPVTAGLAGLLFSYNPALTPSQVENILKQTAFRSGTDGWNPQYGYGRIDAGAALALATTMVVPGDTIPPTAPGSLLATVDSSVPAVNLVWGASTDNVGVSGYSVYRNNVLWQKTASLTLTDNSVSAGQTNTYAVNAYDSAGNVSGFSNSATVTVPAPSVAITGISVTKKTGGNVVVNWTTNIASTGVVKFSTNAGNLDSSATDGTAGTTHKTTLPLLKANTVYYYQVLAVSFDGRSSAVSAVSSFRSARK